MPRLSVNIPALGLDVAVLVRDLHQLVDPDGRARWYAWSAEHTAPVAQARGDLLTKGLPWLEKHLEIKGLVDALEQERDRPRARGTRAWWHLGTRDVKDDTPPTRLNSREAPTSATSRSSLATPSSTRPCATRASPSPTSPRSSSAAIRASASGPAGAARVHSKIDAHEGRPRLHDQRASPYA